MSDQGDRLKEQDPEDGGDHGHGLDQAVVEIPTRLVEDVSRPTPIADHSAIIQRKLPQARGRCR